jgi:dienelactone hydrolase
MITAFGVLSVLALEAALVLLCFGRAPLASVRAGRFGLLVAGQMLLACVFVFGAYTEMRWDLSRNVLALKTYRIPELEPAVLQGDPGLLTWTRTAPPPARPDFSSPEAFHLWQTELRTSLLNVFDLPGIAAPVEVPHEVLKTDRVEGGIQRTLLKFKSFDGADIPAFLLVPPGETPRPAVLVLHGHVQTYEVGISQTAGLVDSYQHSAALELAKAGFVTLTFEFRGFGYLGSRINAEHRVVAYNALLGGSFYKGIVAKDTRYAFDLLQSMPEVKPDSIGITGVSFGGEMAATYGALDERVKAVVFQGYGGQLGPYPSASGPHQDFQPHGCHLVPGHNKHLWQEDLFLLTAPRPLLGLRGDQDFHSDQQAFTETVARGYRATQAEGQFQFEIEPGGHEFFNAPAIEFFHNHL